MTRLVSAITPHQSTFFAHRVTLEGTGEDGLAQSLSTARVDMNPHQVDAALFALASPLSKGVVLADEGTDVPNAPQDGQNSTLPY